MKAYLNDPAIKDEYLSRVKAHREADQLVQGYGYWNDGKGCAVGCTIHSGKHADYETLLGIPRTLARLEDCMFEGLPVEDARQWPERFLSSIAVGAGLSLVWPRFAAWLLSESAGILTFTDRNRTAIAAVESLYLRAITGDSPTVNEWHAAACAANAAAGAANAACAANAANASANAAAGAANAACAANAANAAYAAYAANAAACAANAEACAANAEACAFNAEACAARKKSWKKMANKLLELLAEAA